MSANPNIFSQSTGQTVFSISTGTASITTQIAGQQTSTASNSAPTVTAITNPSEKEMSEQEAKDYAEFINKIRTGDLKKNEYTGNTLSSLEKFDIVGMSTIPTWLRIEGNLIQIFTELAARNALCTFIKIFQKTQEKSANQIPIDFMPILRHQDDVFFIKCGQFLMMAALSTADIPTNVILSIADINAALSIANINIVRFLIINKNISPNFELEQIPATLSPLAMLIRNARGNSEKVNELLVLFLQKGCDFNRRFHTDMRFFCCSPLVLAVKCSGCHFPLPMSVLEKLMELGANPFIFDKSNDPANPLQESYWYRKPGGIEILLNYGAGLLRKELRTTERFGEVDYVTSKKHVQPETLKTKDIIFFNLIAKQWVYTVKELREIFDSAKDFDEQTEIRMNIIARSVLDSRNAVDVLEPGVTDAFNTYYAFKVRYLRHCYEALREQFPAVLAILTSEFLEKDPVLIREATTNPVVIFSSPTASAATIDGANTMTASTAAVATPNI